jgi:hypothetical protein
MPWYTQPWHLAHAAGKDCEGGGVQISIFNDQFSNHLNLHSSSLNLFSEQRTIKGHWVNGILPRLVFLH